MLLCMRTTIDLPDALLAQARRAMAEKKVTFRDLVITALRSHLAQDQGPFRLEDASVGDGCERVSAEAIQAAIDDDRARSLST